MNKKRIIALIAAVIVAVGSVSVFAAPTAAPDNSTSTVTSPDGTTKTISNSDGSETKDTDKNNKDKKDDSDDDDSESKSTPAPTKKSEESASEQTPEATKAPASLGDGITMEDPTLTPPQINYAQSALLMDMNSGRVLYSKNLDERVYPASTTKIMTGILALENLNMDDTVTATYEALKTITLEDSHMGILMDEQLTVEQLIKGMLVYSANDAANVLAIQVSGSIDDFVGLMNQKAQELGMTNTHFANPCGVHDDNHYTTARDMAILSKYAMKNESFREIVKIPIYKIPPTNKYTSERILVNTNLFLGTSRSTYYYYPPAIGIKTGHTSQAGYCLVSAAAYNDIEFLSIVMNCRDADTREQAYSYIDSKALFNFGFDNYSHIQIADVGDIVADSKVYEAKEDMRVAVTVENKMSGLIPNGKGNDKNVKTNINLPEKLQAPIKKGDVLGTVEYTYNDVPLGTTNLVATNDVERNNLLHIFHIIIKVITSPFFFVPVIILIIILLYSGHRKKKLERQKKIQQLKKNRQQNEIGKRTPDRNASRTERNQRDTKGENSRYKNQ